MAHRICTSVSIESSHIDTAVLDEAKLSPFLLDLRDQPQPDRFLGIIALGSLSSHSHVQPDLLLLESSFQLRPEHWLLFPVPLGKIIKIT